MTTLFLTELWERFSYYGMRAILVLFMVAPVAEGGLGFDTKQAASLYGTYTMMVYLLALPGGFMADRWLGPRRAVLLGGILMACGQFPMAVHSLAFFYAGMVADRDRHGAAQAEHQRDGRPPLRARRPAARQRLLDLLHGHQHRRAAGAAGLRLHRAERELQKLHRVAGARPGASWHWGFGAAGVGMLLGLASTSCSATVSAQAERGVGSRRSGRERGAEGEHRLTREDWKRIGAIFILFAFTIMFWAAYEQKGASLNLFAAKLVSTEIFGCGFPSSWLQSLTPFYVILLAPVFAVLWVQLGDRQPSSPAQVRARAVLHRDRVLLLMTPAAALTAGGKISPLWLVGRLLFRRDRRAVPEPRRTEHGDEARAREARRHHDGPLVLRDVARQQAGGISLGLLRGGRSRTLVRLYGGIAVGLLLATAILAILTPRVEKLMGTVR